MFKSSVKTMLIGTAMVLTAALAPRAQAQTPAPPTGPALAVTFIEAIPANGQAVIRKLEAAAAASRKANGNIGYLVLQRTRDKSEFAILEAWTDLASMEADASSAPVKAAFAAVIPYLKAPIDRRPQTAMMVDASRLKAALAPVPAHAVVITHVDIQPAVKEQGIALVRQYDTQDKNAPGALQFDLTQQTSRMNHTMLLEVWHSAAAQRAHEIDPGTIKFRNAVLPMIGALYDTRLYSPVK